MRVEDLFLVECILVLHYALLQLLAIIFDFVRQIYTHDHLSVKGFQCPNLPTLSSLRLDLSIISSFAVLVHDDSSPRSSLFLFQINRTIFNIIN